MLEPIDFLLIERSVHGMIKSSPTMRKVYWMIHFGNHFSFLEKDKEVVEIPLYYGYVHEDGPLEDGANWISSPILNTHNRNL